MVTTGYPICSVNVFIMFDTFVPSPAAVLACDKDQTMHSIHRKKNDGGCTFYHNTLRAKLSPLGIWKDVVLWQSFLH